MEELLSQVVNINIIAEVETTESLLMRVEIGITKAEQLIQMVTYGQLHHPFTLQQFLDLRRELNHAQAILYRHLCIQTSSTSAHNIAGNLTARCFFGSPGRPMYIVNIDQVELLRSSGYTWQEIADCLGVSRSTLWRRLRECNCTIERYTDISDHELDRMISIIWQEHPNIGQSVIYGYLRSTGIHVQRYRLHNSLSRVDLTQQSLRWYQRLTRRTYFVPGPNSLWHVDGHHSMIRWQFVIHGGMDGFSRYIVFLHCSTNNRGSTVLDLFMMATFECGIPSRVRSDGW